MFVVQRHLDLDPGGRYGVNQGSQNQQQVLVREVVEVSPRAGEQQFFLTSLFDFVPHESRQEQSDVRLEVVLLEDPL